MSIKTDLNRFIDSEVSNKDVNEYSYFRAYGKVIYKLSSPKSFNMQGCVIKLTRLSFTTDSINSEIEAILHILTKTDQIYLKVDIDVIRNGNGTFYNLSENSYKDLVSKLSPKEVSLEDSLKTLLGTTDVIKAVKELIAENSKLNNKLISLKEILG